MNTKNFTYLKRAFIRSYISNDSDINNFVQSFHKIAAASSRLNTPKVPPAPNININVSKKPLNVKGTSTSLAPKLDLDKKPINNTKNEIPSMSFIKDNTGNITGYAGASEQTVNDYFKNNPTANPELKKQWDSWNKYRAQQSNMQQDYINKNYGGNAAQASASYLNNLYNKTNTAEGRIEYKKFKSMIDRYGYGDPNVINYAVNNMQTQNNSTPDLGANNVQSNNVQSNNINPSSDQNIIAQGPSREQLELENYENSEAQKLDNFNQNLNILQRNKNLFSKGMPNYIKKQEQTINNPNTSAETKQEIYTRINNLVNTISKRQRQYEDLNKLESYIKPQFNRFESRDLQYYYYKMLNENNSPQTRAKAFDNLKKQYEYLTGTELPIQQINF